MSAKKPSKTQRKKPQKRTGKEKAARKIDALKEERRQLELAVARLQRQLDAPPDDHGGAESPDGDPVDTAASSHKIDWTRYAYLHDRYEFHVEGGAKKGEARRLANQDLIEKFGKEAGYTDQQLKCIFL